MSDFRRSTGPTRRPGSARPPAPGRGSAPSRPGYRPGRPASSARPAPRMASQRGRLTIIMAAFLVLAIGLASRALQLQA
ncbi:MAG: penicillin-binding protein 2, partial [Cutibacterium avidum]|nr:penicillin-binding protein 2 [Cutibacterium avidum]